MLYQENDWVYVIADDQREGFIPHSYCAPYTSHMSELTLTVKKKLPREMTVGIPDGDNNHNTTHNTTLNSTRKRSDLFLDFKRGLISMDFYIVFKDWTDRITKAMLAPNPCCRAVVLRHFCCNNSPEGISNPVLHKVSILNSLTQTFILSSRYLIALTSFLSSFSP